MNQRTTEEHLIARLRSQAAMETREFSGPLHERIMERVRRAATPRAGMMPVRPGLRFGRLLPLASAAILLVSAAVAWNLGSGRQISSVVKPVVAPLSMPTLPRIDLRATAPLAREIEDARYAYLDRDAQRATSYLLRQLDVLP